MPSKIEQVIEEIENLVENAKPALMSSSNIVVNRDELEALIQALKEKAPSEIKEYQRIISNRDEILADAKKKADAIVSAAQIQTDQLVSEHQIMQQAYAKANEVIQSGTAKAQQILDDAQNEANNIKLGAIAYTDKMLATVEDVLLKSIDTTRIKADSYLGTMQGYLDIVTENRRQLAPGTSNSSQQQ